ncbi:MAG: hypothetical protein ACK4QL_10995 [Pseudanabaenaceae cyanobacterium]
MGARIFYDADVDPYLNQQTQTYQVELDRLAECTPQGFRHAGTARGLFTKADVDQCLQQYLLS